jgi:outer membrane protein assembly factor BamB
MSKNLASKKLKIQASKFGGKLRYSSMMKSSAAAFVFLMFASAFLVFSASEIKTVNAQTTSIPSNLIQYEWLQASSTPQGTDFSNGPAPNAPNIKWKAPIPGISGQPVAFNGLVFVQAVGTTYALDGGTGSVVWKAAGKSGSICKIDSTYMAIGSSCVKISDGTTVWVGPPGFSASVTALNGAGYVAELKMFIDYWYGWNLPDPSKPPTLAWNRTLEYDVGHGYIIAYGEGKIFVGTEDGLINGIDAKTGNVIWQSPSTSTSHIYGGVYIDGKVIHGGLDNNMYAWNATTGQKLWTYNPGTWYGQWASDSGAAYGMIYEHNQDNYIYAINATTGKMVWRSMGPGIGYSGCLVIADGKVYSPMGEYQYRDFQTGVYAYPEYNCYDAYTGKLIWTLPLETGAGPGLHECIAYGNLYIIPTKGSPAIPGFWEYGGGGTLGELWCISSAVPDSSMFMSDPAHSAEGSGPTNLALKWKFQTGAEIVSQPTEANGVCYFGSLDNKIYAVDANTGSQKWTFTTGYQVKSSLAVVGGKVYSGADDGNIYCLDANTGTQLWKTYAGGVTKNQLGSGTYLNIAPPVRSSPMVLNGKVYVGSLDGNLYCLDANSGSVVWKYATNGPILATPTIVSGKIFFPSSTGGYPMTLATPPANGDFYCLDANNGSVLWQNAIPYVLNETAGYGNFLFASPTVAEGMVFVSNGFLYNYAFNATTGATIWTHKQKFNSGTPFQTGGAIQMNAPLYKYGRLYLNDYYGISCLNAANGSELWYTYISRENVAQGLVYAYGRVYTVTDFGVLYVLDALTGAKLSYYEFGGYQMHSAPSVYNGNLYVGCNDWNLYCFGDARVMAASAPKPQVLVSDAPISSLAVAPIVAEPSVTETVWSLSTVYIAIAAAVIAVAASTAAVVLRRRK